MTKLDDRLSIKIFEAKFQFLLNSKKIAPIDTFVEEVVGEFSISFLKYCSKVVVNLQKFVLILSFPDRQVFLTLTSFALRGPIFYSSSHTLTSKFFISIVL